jgi:hypothetical protein
MQLKVWKTEHGLAQAMKLQGNIKAQVRARAAF